MSSLEINDLIQYKEMVDRKAASKSTEVLPNSGKEHAAIVMSKMFDLSVKQANMLVGSFDGQISDQTNYLEALKKCIEKGVSFNVLFVDDPNKSSETYKLLLYEKSNGRNINMRNANAEIMALLPKQPDGKPVHFAVFDNTMYRLEKDTKNYIAWFCFNDSEKAEDFNRIFEKSFAMAKA